MTIGRILCPVDFSQTSAHAVDYAVVLACHYKARLTALHVVGPAEPWSDELSVEDRRREVSAFLAPAEAKHVPLDVIVEAGQPARHILDCAASLPADLIVMGTHGKSGFEHLMLGSVTEKVLRKARRPVLTVPPRADAAPRVPFERVLCAVDCSDASLTAVEAALSLSKESGACLTLLHVLEWPWDEPPAPTFEDLPAAQGAALAEFRRYLEQSAGKRLRSLIPESAQGVTTRLMSGKPYAQILAVAAEERSDVIVIGVRRRPAIDMALFGSTANQLVRRATCPVLTLR